MVIFKGMAIKTDHAKGLGLALDSGSKLGCDVPGTNPPIHLWLRRSTNSRGKKLLTTST